MVPIAFLLLYLHDFQTIVLGNVSRTNGERGWTLPKLKTKLFLFGCGQVPIYALQCQKTCNIVELHVENAFGILKRRTYGFNSCTGPSW